MCLVVAFDAWTVPMPSTKLITRKQGERERESNVGVNDKNRVLDILYYSYKKESAK